MALRDEVAAAISERDAVPPMLTPGVCRAMADDILALLPEHRDELLAMLLAPDESVCRNGGPWTDGDGAAWFVYVEEPLSATGRTRRAALVPVSGAEPRRRVSVDCPHDTFEDDGGHERSRCVRCGLAGDAEREPSGEDDDHG